MDDPAVTVSEPIPVVRPAPWTALQNLRGIRRALLGIELTLLAILFVLLSGMAGLNALVAFVVGIVGGLLVLSAIES